MKDSLLNSSLCMHNHQLSIDMRLLIPSKYSLGGDYSDVTGGNVWRTCEARHDARAYPFSM
jgi:hypothetical protein